MATAKQWQDHYKRFTCGPDCPFCDAPAPVAEEVDEDRERFREALDDMAERHARERDEANW